MEYIKANGTEYACQKITTGLNEIYFTIANGDIGALAIAFKIVTSFTVSGEDKVVYGTYSSPYFKSALVDAQTNVTITMEIGTDIEKRVASVEKSQEIQNGAIDDLGNVIGG